MRHLLLNLEGPLLAFGGETVDARGVVADAPAASMLTGLLAAALGLRRGEADRHARLQERLTFAARLDREGTRLADFQTAALGPDDRGWTTRGRPEGRAGGPGTYASPHIRRRDYDADKKALVALRLSEADEAPTLDDLAAALMEPARPLFLGRKSCPPAGPLLVGFVEAASLLEALKAHPLADQEDRRRSDVVRLFLPASEGAEKEDERRMVTDERDWRVGVHAGGRPILIRTLPRSDFPRDCAA